MSEIHPSSTWRHRAYESLRGSEPKNAERFVELMRHERFPRASAYDPSWVFTNHMGPNVVWLTDALTQAVQLEPGMRVLDMGCGTAMSSIFLAREFGVEVWAADLWVPAYENFRRVREAGLMERVYPIHAEARAYPFQRDFFDAALSVDSYHYWGCEAGYLDYLAGFVKPGGLVAIVVPGDALDTAEPGTFHSAEWWSALWEQCPEVVVEHAEMLDGGWDLWWQFCEAGAAWAGRAESGDMELLRENSGMGFTRVVARRIGSAPGLRVSWVLSALRWARTGEFGAVRAHTTGVGMRTYPHRGAPLAVEAR